MNRFNYINEPKTDSFIYGLLDPRNGELRYIGQTTKGKRRFRNLYAKHELNRKTHKMSWLKNLKTQGLKPDILILEEVEEALLSEVEIFYIAYFKSLGCRLTNHTAGGEGSRIPYTEERKIKQRYNNPNNRKVINLETKEIYISAAEAARKIGYKSGSVSSCLNRHKSKQNYFSCGGQYLAWLPKNVPDLDCWCNEELKKLKDKEFKVHSKKASKKVKNHKTGEIYNSVKEASNILGYSYLYLIKILLKQKVTKKLHITYVNKR